VENQSSTLRQIAHQIDV